MATREKDACDLLDTDHRNVRKMFKEYEELTQSRARGAQKKMDLARQICMELTVHARPASSTWWACASSSRRGRKN